MVMMKTDDENIKINNGLVSGAESKVKVKLILPGVTTKIARPMTPHMAAITSSAMNKPRQFFASYPTTSWNTHV